MSLYLTYYTKEIQKIISNTKLSKEQLETLERCLNKIGEDSPYFYVFEDMYKLNIADISTTDIAKAYNKSIRMIQTIFKNVGISRDKIKAQSIAVKKRDYVKIRATRKQTTLDREAESTIVGSKIEGYIRAQLSLSLNEIVRRMGGETIVGINTVTPVGELDIPILILFGEHHYKYGIEADGNYYHSKEYIGNLESDTSKTKRLNEIGYKIYRLETKAYYNEDRDNITYSTQIKDKLSEIVSDIAKDLDSKLHIA